MDGSLGKSERLRGIFDVGKSGGRDEFANPFAIPFPYCQLILIHSYELIKSHIRAINLSLTRHRLRQADEPGFHSVPLSFVSLYPPFLQSLPQRHLSP